MPPFGVYPCPADTLRRRKGIRVRFRPTSHRQVTATGSGPASTNRTTCRSAHLDRAVTQDATPLAPMKLDRTPRKSELAPYAQVLLNLRRATATYRSKVE